MSSVGYATELDRANAEIVRLREENTRLAELALEAKWLLEHRLDAPWNEWQGRRRKWLARWAKGGE